MSRSAGHRECSPLVLDKKWFHVPLPLKQCSLKELATTVVSKEKTDEYFQHAQSLLDRCQQEVLGDRSEWYLRQFQSRGTTSDKIASAAVKLSDNDFMFFLDGFNLLFETARTDSHHFESALKALVAVWPRLLPARPLKKFSIAGCWSTTRAGLPLRSGGCGTAGRQTGGGRTGGVPVPTW